MRSVKTSIFACKSSVTGKRYRDKNTAILAYIQTKRKQWKKYEHDIRAISDYIPITNCIEINYCVMFHCRLVANGCLLVNKGSHERCSEVRSTRRDKTTTSCPPTRRTIKSGGISALQLASKPGNLWVGTTRVIHHHQPHWMDATGDTYLPRYSRTFAAWLVQWRHLVRVSMNFDYKRRLRFTPALCNIFFSKNLYSPSSDSLWNDYKHRRA